MGADRPVGGSGDQDRDEEEARGERGREQLQIVGDAPSALIAPLHEAHGASAEMPWVERDRGAGVSHGEMLNSHLTMFNGLVGHTGPSRSGMGLLLPFPARGRGRFFLWNARAWIGSQASPIFRIRCRQSIQIGVFPACLDLNAGADGGSRTHTPVTGRGF